MVIRVLGDDSLGFFLSQLFRFVEVEVEGELDFVWLIEEGDYKYQLWF